MFATQDLPDIYTGPAWAGGGEMSVILKAAHENQLVDLTPYLAKYPNLANAVAENNVPKDMWDTYFNPEIFGGKSYMLYSQMPATGLDVTDWLYGLYARKDIVEKLGLDPLSVRTPDDLYQFLKAIKDANLEENGQSIIPMGGFAGGWAVNFVNKFFYNANLEYFVNNDGTMQYNFMTDRQDDYVLYMRKLFSEGLIDPESYVQTEAIATEKVNQGRIAVFAAHFYHIYNSTKAYRATNPAAEFVPVGPLNDWFGDPYKTVSPARGANINIITKKSKNPDAAARLLDFLYSDEGNLLANYGVEGIHYDLVDGKPVAKAEWVEKAKTDNKAFINEGFTGAFGALSGPDRSVSKWGGKYGHGSDPVNAAAAEMAKIMRKNGLEIVQGINPAVYAKSLPEWEKVKPIVDQLEGTMRQAYYAKTDEEALALINAARKQLVDAGIHDIEAKVNELGKTVPLTQYISRN
jgi:putative aldouronate transport system substrate-binding protein